MQSIYRSIANTIFDLTIVLVHEEPETTLVFIPRLFLTLKKIISFYSLAEIKEKSKLNNTNIVELSLYVTLFQKLQ